MIEFGATKIAEQEKQNALLESIFGRKLGKQDAPALVELTELFANGSRLGTLSDFLGVHAGTIDLLRSAMVGVITVRTLCALVRIAQASGKDARGVMAHHGLPAIIVSLGGEITEGQLDKLAAIAQASGEGTMAVMEFGIPTVIKSLGGKITEALLEGYGIKLAALAQASGEDAQHVMGLGLRKLTASLGGQITEGQLDKLAAIAQASGKSAYAVMESGLPAVIQSLDSEITEELLERHGAKLAAIAQASGEGAWKVMAFSLPAMIKSLGGVITEEQLEGYGAKLAAIAQASGNNVHEVMEYGLPVVIKSLGSKITEEQLERYGAKVVAIAQASGEGATRVMAYGLPAVIQSLDGRITEELLERYGAKLAAIAQASGEDARPVMESSLPAVIAAGGGGITEEQLAKLAALSRAAGAKTVQVFDAVSVILKILKDRNTYPASDVLERVAESFNSREDHHRDRLSYVVRTVLQLAELTFNDDQNFDPPKRDFTERTVAWIDRELPAALKVSDKQIVVDHTVSSSGPRFMVGKSFDAALYSAVCKDYFVDGARRNQILSSLWQMAGVGAPAEASPNSETEKAAIFGALKKLSGKQLGSAIKLLRPILPGITGVELKQPSTDLPDAKKVEGLYPKIQEIFTGHIPEVLPQNGIQLDQTAKQEIYNFLHSIKGEFDKLTMGGEKVALSIDLVATKNVWDAFYDAIGENCAGQYGFALEDEKFQPIRLIDKQSKEHIGVIYALKGEVAGKPALVLAGVEIRKRYAYSIGSNELIKKLVGRLSEIAQENGLSGGVWATVGPAKEGKPWSDDGRIGQYDLIREAVVGLGIERAGEREAFVNLDVQEQIQFPPTFERYISRVVRLDEW